MYNIKTQKLIPLSICILVMGVIGTHIMFFLENGAWYGRSFFGAVLFFPLLLFPISLLFRIDIIKLVDYATIPGMAALSLAKLNCYISGCCEGRVLWYTDLGAPVHFPSQLVEMSCAMIITLALLLFEKKRSCKGKIYPVCLIAYGILRFILNWFRWDRDPLFMGLSAGHIWSIVSIIIGFIWLGVRYIRITRKQQSEP